MADVTTLYNEADKLKDDGKFDEAVVKLRAILSEDEAYTLAHLALAVVLGRLGQHKEAVEHGRRACELEPTEPFNFTALSVTCQRAFAGTQEHSYIGMAEDAMAKAAAMQQRP